MANISIVSCQIDARLCNAPTQWCLIHLTANIWYVDYKMPASVTKCHNSTNFTECWLASLNDSASRAVPGETCCFVPFSVRFLWPASVFPQSQMVSTVTRNRLRKINDGFRSVQTPVQRFPKIHQLQYVHCFCLSQINVNKRHRRHVRILCRHFRVEFVVLLPFPLLISIYLARNSVKPALRHLYINASCKPVVK